MPVKVPLILTFTWPLSNPTPEKNSLDRLVTLLSCLQAAALHQREALAQNSAIHDLVRVLPAQDSFQNKSPWARTEQGNMHVEG